MPANQHPRQRERLAALQSYGLMDTGPETDFDDIATLAAAICDTPVSLISFVDADRQWFKARIGLEQQQTPMHMSICSYAILQDQLMEIADTQADPRTADNPLCIGDQPFRFYAGAQLVGEDSLPLGTLCVLDYRPRQLTQLQRDALRILARQVTTQMELRKTLHNADMLRREVDHRVKNSLQSLASLARIERREAESTEVADAMDMMANRLDAVATLHEILYQTEPGPNVNLSDYLDRISDHLRQLLPENLTLTYSGESVLVASEQAVAVGTLINELTANSIKHAVPDGRDGQIVITLAIDADGKVVMVYRDNGVGFQDAAPRVGALGVKIIEVACAQLDCDIVTGDAEPGMMARFSFEPMTRD